MTSQSTASSPDTLSMLRGVKGYIARGWTQGAQARDAELFRCLPRDPRAECWCLLGAAMAIMRDTDPVAVALGFRHGTAMVVWNDTKGRTKAEVIARIDQALSQASDPSSDIGGGDA